MILKHAMYSKTYKVGRLFVWATWKFFSVIGYFVLQNDRHTFYYQFRVTLIFDKLSWSFVAEKNQLWMCLMESGRDIRKSHSFTNVDLLHPTPETVVLPWLLSEPYIISLSQRTMGHRQIECVELSTQTELFAGSPRYISYSEITSSPATVPAFWCIGRYSFVAWNIFRHFSLPIWHVSYTNNIIPILALKWYLYMPSMLPNTIVVITGSQICIVAKICIASNDHNSPKHPWWNNL